MKQSDKQWPISPPSNEVENKATREFDYRCSSKWIPNKPEKDFGWDRMVDIKENSHIKGKNFLVQIKGSNNPKYINNRKFISYQLKVRTINFLVSQFMPSMLCVCDICTDDKLIYWEWIQEAINRIKEKNSNWNNQKTVSIQIPTSQVLNEESYSIIESYVKKYFEEISIQQELGKVLTAPYDPVEQNYSPQRYEIQKNLNQEVYLNLMELGLLDVISKEDMLEISALSLREQKIHKKIKDSSQFLKSFFDKKAEETLNQLSKEIKNCSDGIKSKYYNNYGVLALHNYDKRKAKKFFKKAFELRPDNEKFAVNLLHVEYELAIDKGDLSKNLPDDWVKRLESVLKKKPDYNDAIFLKAHWMSKSRSIREAEKTLKLSSSWKNKIIESRIILADIYVTNNQLDKALNLFEEIEEKKEIIKDEIFWSYYGHIFFFKSIGKGEVQHEILLKGPGPSVLNRSYLLRADECYEKALDKFKDKGMPKISEQTIVNYTAVLSLLGKYRKSEYICILFLNHHPESIPILENLILSLSFQNNQESLDLATHYGKKAFKLKPLSTKVFCNLILSLLLNEDYEEINELISEREKQGFTNINEEGLSKAIYAISLNELGYSSESKQQIVLMKNNPNLVIDTALAEAEIEKRNGADVNKYIKILEKALKIYPDNPDLNAKISQYLKPLNTENAEKIINCLTIVTKKRQLTSGEYALLGKAYLEQENPEKAHEIFYNAIIRYPEEIQFLYLTAISLYEAGREEDAFNCLNEYMKKSKKDYALLKNLAILALNTGKLKESIELFEKTISKTENAKEKAEIHCILYELKKREKRPPKDILRHVIAYGKITDGKVDAEARFLIMGLLSPTLKKEEIDSEIKSWLREFKNRLHKFSEQHPDYKNLRTMKIPDDIPDKEKGQYILYQLACLTFPQKLALTPFRLSIESQPWPLALRAQLLPESSSIFEFWAMCTKSNEFSKAIHIWSSINNLVSENKIVFKNNEVCIDINALLTLAELDMLNYLEKYFDKIIISRGTKVTIDKEIASPFATHPLAEKIEQWRLNNKKIIRIKKLKRKELTSKFENETTNKSIYIHQRSIDKLIGDGVGESLLLAKKLGCPLYSDDSLLRKWGTDNYDVESFSTLSFISLLKNKGFTNTKKETYLYSQMIEKNFRVIPFKPYHLSNRLEEIIKERNEKSQSLPKNQDLKTDPIIGPFLKQFGESSIPPITRAKIAIRWWISILRKKSIRESIDECMEFISFCLSQETKSGILKGIRRNENKHNVALLWAVFWWKCNLTDPNLSCLAWLAIKENCGRLFSTNEQLQEQVLFKLIPGYIIQTIEKTKDLDIDKKIQYLYRLTDCFKSGENDKNKLETAFTKLKNRIR